MDPIFLVEEERAQKNLQKKHRYENFTTKVRFVETLYTKL